jgi:hypothetical protein
MNYLIIEGEWEKSEFPKPEIIILQTFNKKFAVVEDSSSIIFVVSKTEIVYAVTKNKVNLKQDENGNYFYYVEDIDNLKIVSCTRETIEKRHKSQFFVITKIIKHL